VYVCVCVSPFFQVPEVFLGFLRYFYVHFSHSPEIHEIPSMGVARHLQWGCAIVVLSFGVWLCLYVSATKLGNEMEDSPKVSGYPVVISNGKSGC